MIYLLLFLPVAVICLMLLVTRKPPAATVLLRAMLEPCGCLRLEGGLVLPCPAHDPAAEPPVEQWAAEIGREES